MNDWLWHVRAYQVPSSSYTVLFNHILLTDNRSLEDPLVQATVFSVPFGAFSIDTGVANISPPNLLIIITVIYFGAVMIPQERLRLSRVQIYALGLLCVLILVISVTSFVQQGRSRRLVTYIGVLLLSTVLLLYVDSISDAKRVLRAAFLSAVVVSILTIVHSITYPAGLPFGRDYLGQRTVAGVTVPFQRTIWLPTSYSGFGMMLMIGTPYYLYIALKKRSKIILFGVSSILFAVLISQSRSTWAATVLALFIVISGYIIKERGEKANITYLLSVIFPTILLLPAGLNVLISIRADTFFSRIKQYQAALDIMQSNPLVGEGLNNVEQSYAGSIHSEFFRLGAEAGVVAFLLFITIWTIPILSVSKGIFSSSSGYALKIGVLASIIAMIIESNMAPGLSKAPWIVLIIGLGHYFTD